VRLPSDQEASGRSFGDEELVLLRRVIESGILASTKGTTVRQFERRFAERLGSGRTVACASGTAALHTAIAAIDPEPGEEIVTSPITDMGAITPILYQGAIPVFADVDPHTCNLTAKTIAPRLSGRTRAIVVTHLFGNPAEMAPILELAARHGIPVIEDCAQAYLAETDGRIVGTLGTIGCFSLQQGKHIACGEGGLVATNDRSLARRIELFVNKAWGYGDPDPDHTFLALNYRMTELQGAVALAQLGKLQAGVERRRAMAKRLDEALAGIPGVATPLVAPGAVHSYWRYCLRIDGNRVAGGSPALGAALKRRGIAAAPRYIQKPAFRCAVIREQRTFGNSRFPFTLARAEAVDYRPEQYPGVFEGLRDVLVLPWNEGFTVDHIDYIATAVREALAEIETCRS
jgi:perosamine synthetase